MTRLLRTILLAATACALAAPPATAAEPKQASKGLKAYGLDWIEAIPPDALPPTRYAVCIVDSGVAITPDTPPDNPNGPILRRLSIDGGSGEPQGTSPEQLHGTRMAMASIAPRNGWGTVGMNPAGRVVSVRVLTDGVSAFGLTGYTRGVNDCMNLLSEIPIAAINLSFGCPSCQLNPADVARLQDVVKRARRRGIEVIASAGNDSGRVQFPANVDGVLAVAAGGNRGRLCSYGAWEQDAFAIAPACPVQSADPLSGAFEPKADGGSSVASVEVASLIAALRTMRPDASSAEVLGWIQSSRRLVRGRYVLSGRKAAALAGLTVQMARADEALAKRVRLRR